MKKLVIDKIATHIDNDPYPYVRFFKREEMPVLPSAGNVPIDATVTYETLKAWTFIDGNGKEVNLCMPEEVREVLGLPLGVVARLNENLAVARDIEYRIRVSRDNLKLELNRLSEFQWYQRLWAVFFGLGVKS